MKGKLLLLAGLMALAQWLPAQEKASADSITVAYEWPQEDQDLLRDLMEFQGIHCFDVQVRSTSKLPYTLSLVHIVDGREERSDIFSPFPLALDTLRTFRFIAQAVSPDTVRIAYKGQLNSERKIAMPTRHCILMETLPPHAYAPTDTIPLIAYTPGHETSVNMNGQEMTGIDFCGVRFSGKHPSEWHQAFGIKNYFYFELILSPRKEDSNKEQ